MLKRNEVERWRCTKNDCIAHLKIVKDSIVEENAQHNHNTVDEVVQKRKEISSLKRKASEILHDRPRKIALIIKYLRRNDVGKFLRLFYGMSMLSPDEVEDFFIEDIMDELQRIL